VSGCAATEAQVERALLADGNPPAHARDLEVHYQVRCPDVLDIAIGGHPDRSGRYRVGADGCIQIGADFRVRVSGHTAPDIAQAIARRLPVPETTVRVRVVEHRSRSLYVFCEGDPVQRDVDYRGPETIVDLLQRLGGLAPGATPGDVQVVRAHVADGQPPEVFHVNLPAILFHHDLQTNIRLEPFDRVYIGQSRRSRVASCIPPLLLPLYRLLCGIRE
jgi:protein involved in polysaccharide export with SLBB domain